MIAGNKGQQSETNKDGSSPSVVSYVKISDTSESDIQRRIDNAFDVLFSEMYGK